MDFLKRTRSGCARKPIHLAIAVMLFLQVGIFTGTAGAEAKTQYAHSVPPEDTSTRFLVKEIKISGNTLVSTAALLENLPAVYTVSVQREGTTVKKVYDFRVLHEIILEPGQEREVSKETIDGLTRYLLSVYREKGYAGIYVYVPAKAVKGVAELEDGILPIEVLEGKVAKVTIDRYDFNRQEVEKEVLKSSVLKSWSPVKEGQVIRKKELDDFVRLLNLNSDRYVSAVISKGDKPDTLNLGYDVYEANPWHWYVQLDNSGTDKCQWNPRVGVVNTNLTGRDDRFSFMYQAPLDRAEENYLLYGNYEFPFLTPRLRLGVYAGYSGFKIAPEIGGGINFLGNGSFYGGTLRYNVLQVNDWFFDFLGSLGHESSKVTPSLGIEADVDTDLFGIGGEVHRSDNMSSTSVSFNRTQSFNASSKEDFANARWDTNPDFAIYTLSASHKQFLDKSQIHELSGSFRGITSNHRLVPANMTTFGGLYSVRGYKEDEIVADGGILASLQYRFDLTKYLEKGAPAGAKEKQPSFKKKAWPPDVSLLTFIDYGRAEIKDPVPGEVKAQELLGTGVGTAVELGNNAYGAIYYSWPLRSTELTKAGEGRWNFNFIYRF
ncbi:MAG: ShlB/FhaC/HecB family hemolysin secretion/activation protein [Sedimentisphaerales bacterium]